VFVEPAQASEGSFRQTMDLSGPACDINKKINTSIKYIFMKS